MKRQLYLTAGLISVALGSIGVVLPLLPTVPFMILAAFCFANSSPRLESWLLEHRIFGTHIRNWRDRRAITRRGKWAATLAFAVSCVIALLFVKLPWNLIPIAAALISGSWIWTRNEPGPGTLPLRPPPQKE
jgi:uncharacterized membrane protein YbaN (DUF454 family)